MRKKVKQFLGTALAFVMIFGMLTQNVMANEDTAPSSVASETPPEINSENSYQTEPSTQQLEETSEEQQQSPDSTASASAESEEDSKQSTENTDENLTRGSPADSSESITEVENNDPQESPESQNVQKNAPRQAPTATTSSDLALFLTNVSSNLTPNADGTYTVSSGQSFTLNLTFQEDESKQLDDTANLTYTVPSGLSLNGASGTFDVSVSDETGSGIVSGNTYSVSDGILTVKLNQSDPNFSRLQAEGDVGFTLNFNAQLNGQPGSITFIDDVTYNFDYKEPEAKVSVSKSGTYDANSGLITYTVDVVSTGANTDVTVTDSISGTALVYQKDVSGTSNKSGALSVAASNADSGFTYVIPSMSDGEKVTLTYTAKVDYSKLSGEGRGTYDETNNTVKASSPQDPEGDTASKDFTNLIRYKTLEKTSGETSTDANGNTVVPWTVTANKYRQISLAGKLITDTIDTASQNIMHYSGSGITILVTKEDGSTETRTASWDQLTTTSDSKGLISWSYQVPASDGKYRYQITYDTTVVTAGLISNPTVKNRVTDGNINADGSKEIGIGEDDQLTINKEVVSTSSAMTTWKVTVHVPKSGYDNLTVTDVLPYQWLHDKPYADSLVAGSIQVVGLVGDESYQMEEAITENSANSFTLTFYRDAAHSAPGLVANSESRDIIITFSTNNNPEWMKLYETERVEWYRQHTNNVSAKVNDITKTDSATSTPANSTIVKSLTRQSTTTIDGVTYPVYDYELKLENVTEDSAVLEDTFDTKYLKYYEASGVSIVGGDIWGQYDTNGGAATVTDAGTGITIHVSSFPKNKGAMYDVYDIRYSLIVKDAAALKALDAASIASPDGVTLKNTATWNGQASNEATVTYKYDSLSKELSVTPSNDNHYRATYRLVVNPNAEDLLAGSDQLTLTDVLSSNLRFLEDTPQITPSDGVTYRYQNSTLTMQIPDSTCVEILYSAYVIGEDVQTYTNTATLEGISKNVEETVTIDSSGSGTGSNPYITLHKVSASDHASLAGATYQLYRYNASGEITPVTDNSGNSVSFTTNAEGLARIIGNQNALGWVLWKNSHYALVETVAPVGYSLSKEPVNFTISDTISPDDADTYYSGDVITVSDEEEKTSVSGGKTWDDNNNQDGARPDSITIRLLANGTEVANKTVTENDGWAYEFTDLAKYMNGQEITYTVTEDAVEGYSSSVSGYNVTNTHTPGKTSVAVTKAWNDNGNQDGKRPNSVTIHLLADGEDTGKSVTLTEANNWSASFVDLDQKKNGTDINYTVSEDAVSDYTTTITGDSATGFTVTNTHTPETTSVSGSKIWDDNDNQDGTRPASITIRLLANGTEVANKTVTENDGWTYEFTDLAKYMNGQEITYTVTEDAVKGYSSSVSGYNITNTHTPGKTSVAVTKTWDDNNNQDGKRPDSVTVHLLVDGENTGKTLTLDESNHWSGSFNDLAEYKNGTVISYTVKEDVVSEYTSRITGTAATGFVITNAHTPETVTVSGTKTWDDAGNQDGKRPSSITVQLMKATENGSTTIATKMVAADSNGKWQYSFENLPKYENGELITYKIGEETVKDYTLTVDGYNMINKYTPAKTNIYVAKTWNDDRNKEGIRPKSIIVHLLANGEDTGRTVTLHADNGWSTSFRDLDLYADGVAIQYTVSEDPVAGYIATVTGDSIKGFTITNTHTPGEKVATPKTPLTPTSKTAVSSPKTGDTSNIVLYGTTLATALIALLVLLIRCRKGKAN